MRRGAGTLLNTRLIPLIAEFFQAVKHVMEERNMKMPLAIMRSDGSLMSEEMAREYPVETLLSGPGRQSGGRQRALAGQANAVIVDMGGTTTDVAMVRDKMPLTSQGGIKIGPWKTTINGVYVDTFLLGGDSAVRFREGRLYLDGRRVIPLSFLAGAVSPGTGKAGGAGQAGKRTHTPDAPRILCASEEHRRTARLYRGGAGPVPGSGAGSPSHRGAGGSRKGRYLHHEDGAAGGGGHPYAQRA